MALRLDTTILTTALVAPVGAVIAFVTSFQTPAVATVYDLISTVDKLDPLEFCHVILMLKVKASDVVGIFTHPPK